jgi:hypothetical protein
MPLQATSGAASYDAFGGGIPYIPQFIEELFSTYLYTGNDTSQTINNGIDLAGKGGLVWTKDRTDAVGHRLKDTTLGTTYFLESNSTSAQIFGNYSWQFNSNGYQFSTGNSNFNYLNSNYASWTFRKQPKFFDVVTYTGTGSNTTIAHKLGSIPGCIIVKRTDTTADWQVYHSGLANTQYMVLNSTAAVATDTTRWNSTTPTSSVFSIGTDATVNASGGTYVAYIFATNAGGFGLTGVDNAISCGSFTYDSTNGNSINLGYEAQWVMIKRATGGTGLWVVQDIMRGMVNGPISGAEVFANSASAETPDSLVGPTETGFNIIPSYYTNGDTITYMAIRRGPMKVPTTGTDIFLPKTRTGNGTAATVVTGASWPMDMLWISRRTGGGAGVGGFTDVDRLRGAYAGGNNPLLRQNQADPESTTYVAPGFIGNQTNYELPSGGGYGLFNTNTVTYIDYLFRRAPTFFDVVCYKGTGSNKTVTHNLGVAPELIIIKSRTAAGSDWPVYATAVGATKVAYLDGTGGFNTSATSWNNTATTSSVFTVGTSAQVNASAETYVAYLFGSCSGVSKVGSYTGNGTTQTIDCGFAAGVRFVLIKRTDTTGEWYTYDTARGMTVLTDPYLLMSATTAETATLGSVTTVSTGFAVNESILAGINTSAATYIFLAIA